MNFQEIRMKNKSTVRTMKNHGASRMAVLRKQGGFTMVELGLVLVVAAIALVGVITYFSNNSTAAQSQQLVNDLTSLSGKVKSAYANNYGAITNAKLDTGGFFNGLPALNDVAGVVTTNLGGGTLTVAPGTVTSANDSVMYTITQIPDAACIPLVSAMAKGATKLLVGAKVVKAVGAKADPSQIICANDANTVVITEQ